MQNLLSQPFIILRIWYQDLVRTIERDVRKWGFLSNFLHFSMNQHWESHKIIIERCSQLCLSIGNSQGWSGWGCVSFIRPNFAPIEPKLKPCSDSAQKVNPLVIFFPVPIIKRLGLNLSIYQKKSHKSVGSFVFSNEQSCWILKGFQESEKKDLN